MLKIGLVGVGGISRSHIAAWESMADAELVALCDVRPEMMEKYPEKRRYTSFDEMLEKETLDILDICLPTYLHADYAVKAMNKGLHVLCEKPISLNREDVARVYGAAKENGVCFMVAQVLRFWPAYELVRETFEDGRYGKLLSGVMSRISTCPGWSWDGWMRDEKRSGLTPYDLHIHDLDYMVYAFGKPNTVRQHRAKQPEQDYVQATYEYDGFFLFSEASWYNAPIPFRASFRFQFENAVIVNDAEGLTVYESNGNILRPGSDGTGDTGGINLPKTSAYALEIRYFTDCVKEGRFPDKVQPQELETVIDILNSFPR